jgi:hypothetical protein
MLRVVTLLTLHRILITTLIAFCVFFGWQEASAYRNEGSVVALLIAVASGVVAVAASWYLANLRRYVRVAPRSPPQD